MKLLVVFWDLELVIVLMVGDVMVYLILIWGFIIFLEMVVVVVIKWVL